MTRPINVLHLLPVDADYQTRRTVAQLTGTDLGGEFRSGIRTIGRGGNYRSPLHAAQHLRRQTDLAIIHAWGSTSLMTAGLATQTRLVYSPASGVSVASVRWLRALLAHRQFECVAPSATLRRSFIERGVPADRVHLVRPGVDFGRVRRRRDVQLRKALGLAEDDFVLLAAGESDANARHTDALWTASILYHLDPRFKLLLWGRGKGLGRVVRFSRQLACVEVVRFAEPMLARTVEFEDLIPATDMLLVTATDVVPTLPIAIAMVAGLPIVSAVTYTAGELLEDHHTALMVAPKSPRAMAQKILELKEDAHLQWQVADMARTEAYEFFTQTRMLSQYRTIYRQLADGQTVAVPEPPPGAGLRFHGRG